MGCQRCVAKNKAIEGMSESLKLKMVEMKRLDEQVDLLAADAATANDALHVVELERTEALDLAEARLTLLSQAAGRIDELEAEVAEARRTGQPLNVALTLPDD